MRAREDRQADHVHALLQRPRRRSGRGSGGCPRRRRPCPRRAPAPRSARRRWSGRRGPACRRGSRACARALLQARDLLAQLARAPSSEPARRCLADAGRRPVARRTPRAGCRAHSPVVAPARAAAIVESIMFSSSRLGDAGHFGESALVDGRLVALARQPRTRPRSARLRPPGRRRGCRPRRRR